jgi:glycerol-3-phosphate O-acyltransferase
LANHRRGFHSTELAETVDILLDFLKIYEVSIADTLTDPSKAVKETLSLLINWKVVDCLQDVDGDEETFYYVDEEKKMELEYYKNNIIHFFIPHAFVAISLLTGTEEVKTEESIISDYEFLKNLFKKEFVFDKREDLREKVVSIIEYFLNSTFLSRSGENGGYKVTKLGFDRLPIWAALTKTFLESYWIAVKSISQQKSRAGKGGGNLLKNMTYLGKRFHKLGVIDHIGALSQLNFKNAISFINENILNVRGISDDRSHSLEKLSELGQRLYELSHYRS